MKRLAALLAVVALGWAASSCKPLTKTETCTTTRFGSQSYTSCEQR